jgi:hypothetical protein
MELFGESSRGQLCLAHAHKNSHGRAQNGLVEFVRECQENSEKTKSGSRIGKKKSSVEFQVQMS